MKVSDLSMTEQQDEKAQLLVNTWIHRYRRGSLRFFILHLLLHKHSKKNTEHQSFHGYKLAKAIHEETKGDWSPKTASIYPILKGLVKDNVIEHSPDSEHFSEDSTRPIKQYRLTPYGILVATKLEDMRKDMTRHFISGQGGAPRPPPPMFRLPKEELFKILKNTDADHLEEFHQHFLKMQTQNQEILKFLDTLLKEKKTR